DLRMLLAVDLHRDEAVVDEGGSIRIGERLPRHHVAPVAGRVADRDQQRHVAALGLGKRLFAPRVPLDRVFGVLAEVRTERVGEPVRHTAVLSPPPLSRPGWREAATALDWR